MRLSVPALVGLVLWCVPGSAIAQRVVISYSGFGGTAPITRSLVLETGATDWIEPGTMHAAPVFTADGRYVLLQRPLTPTGPVTLVARDVTTKADLSLPANFEPRIAHPTRREVFGLRDVQSTGFGTTAGTLARLDAAGLTAGGGCAVGTTVQIDLSVDGRTIAALCQAGDIAIVDADSGTLIRTLPAAPGSTFSSLRLNHDNTALLVSRGTSSGTEVALVDAVSGAATATTTVGPAGAACRVSAIAPDRSKAVVGCSYSVPPASIGGEAVVIDVPSLVHGARLPSQIPRDAVFSPDGREVFLASHHRFGFGTVNRHDAATGAITLSSGTVFPGFFGVAFAPLAATLSATVTGARVDLQWTRPAHSPLALSHVIEVGSAPGLTDLGTITTGAAPTLAVPSAPPGHYFVRVRAVNATGAGAASNEVIVDVP
jgi:hypothetical protein